MCPRNSATCASIQSAHDRGVLLARLRRLVQIRQHVNTLSLCGRHGGSASCSLVAFLARLLLATVPVAAGAFVCLGFEEETRMQQAKFEEETRMQQAKLAEEQAKLAEEEAKLAEEIQQLRKRV